MHIIHAIQKNNLNNVNIKKVICGGCGANCGLLIHIKDGKVIKMVGDKTDPLSHGYICERATAIMSILHHKDRLRYPLKRVGERGEGKWKRITWSQATSEIAEKLCDIIRRYGAEAIAFVHGKPRGNDYIQRRFMNLLGSPNKFSSAGQVCWDNDAALECITYGWIAFGDIEHAKCIVEWGNNPEQSDPPKWQKILKAKKEGAKLIVVDPVLSKTAKEADIWLQIRPGTDGALAMGWLNVIIRERLYDENFVEKWTVGFDKLVERVQKYSPEKVAEITHVPANKIIDSARIYATYKPATISTGVSMDHIGKNASQAIRAKAILRAITGNLDIPGGELLTGLHPNVISETEVEENDRLPLTQKKKMLGAEKFRLFSWSVFDQITQHAKKAGYRASIPSYSLISAHAPTVWRAILSEKPYPIKAIICQASNPLVTCANTQLVYNAIKKLEVFVVHDIFMTPTAMLADYVLPAATWLERPCLDTYIAANFVRAGDRALAPIEECKTDFDFIRELGLAMGQEWPWNSLEELYDYRLRPAGYTWYSFIGDIRYDAPSPKYKKYEEKGFATPTGKVEIYSTILESLGYDPLPDYEEPAQSHIRTPELAKSYPLILITGRRFRPMFHSMYRQVEHFRQKHPHPLVEINPETALQLGINDGDWVWIETTLGKVKQKAKISSCVPLNVVSAEHGWWFPEKTGREPILYGLWESNINVVIDDDPEKCDQIVGSWQLRAIPCKIYKVDQGL